MGYGVSQSERASPAAAKDVHLTVDIELTAQPQHVIDQMCGRVVGECRRGIVVACAGCAFATAALVEKNDPVSRRVEKVGGETCGIPRPVRRARTSPARRLQNRILPNKSGEAGPLGHFDSPIFCTVSSHSRLCLVQLIQQSDWMRPRG